MELVKNIFFNTDKLTRNSKVKISYTGKFFQDNSSNVYIHYGFGNEWEELNDLAMEKSDLGFQAEIDLLDYDSFNFCLKNENNDWDNNNGENYVFPLAHQELALIVKDEDNFLLAAPRKLRRTYIWSKKIKIAVYKVLRYIPKLISGNYKRKTSENESSN